MRRRHVGAVLALLGLGVLYVAWINPGPFLQSRPACLVADPAGLHLDANGGVDYRSRCGPFDGAVELFYALTAVGIVCVGVGGYDIVRGRLD